MELIAMDGDETFLPRDIIVDILKRLPVESLLRFRSVSKDWKNLIDNPAFIADHLRHSQHKNSFLLLQRLHLRFDTSTLSLIDCEMKVLGVENIPWIDFLPRPEIVGSSNGLLCVGYADCGHPDSLFVLNPAIREGRQVPRTINDFKGLYHTGFGFSPIVNDYKIVRIYYVDVYDEDGDFGLNGICVNRVEVYSLSTGSWKEVEFGNIQSVNLKSDPVIVNGTMFWLGLKMGSRNEDDDGDLVVSYDMAIEVFTLIPMPALASKSYDDNLTVYENKLAILSHFAVGNLESSLIDLWVMDCATGENWSWSKKYTVGPFPGMLYPLIIWRNEIVCEVHERRGFIDETGREVKCDRVRTVLFLFNPTTNELKKFATYRYGHLLYFFNHAESLVPVGNIHITDACS